MVKTGSHQKFVSEPIVPKVVSAELKAMTTGGPLLPQEFTWRGMTLNIAAVLHAWHETGPCTHGSGESYVRKHWFEIETTTNQRARIYFERKARGRRITRRWWLFSIEEISSGRPLQAAGKERGNHLKPVEENADEYRDNS